MHAMPGCETYLDFLDTLVKTIHQEGKKLLAKEKSGVVATESTE
jgi:hypothetical protein